LISLAGTHRNWLPGPLADKPPSGKLLRDICCCSAASRVVFPFLHPAAIDIVGGNADVASGPQRHPACVRCFRFKPIQRPGPLFIS